ARPAPRAPALGLRAEHPHAESRALLPPRPAGLHADRGPALADPPLDDDHPRPLGHGGLAARAPRGHGASSLARHRHLDLRARLLCHPALLAGPHAHRAVLDPPGLAAHERNGEHRRLQYRLGARPRHRPASDPARGRALPLLHGALHAPHAGRVAGAGGNGLRDDGAGQGALGAAHRLGPHAAERAPARGDHGGAADGGPAGRLRHRGDGLRLAGARAPGLSVALRARSEPSPRHLPPLGLHGGGGESGRGYSLHAARPAHRGGLMAAFSRRYGRNRAAVLGLCILGAVVLLALAAPWISPGSPFRLAGKPLSPPFGEYLFGTDTLGRDVAAGLTHGARTSLLIGLVATAMAVTVGTVLVGLAGLYGRVVDRLLMRVTEFFQTIPAFLFAIVLVAVLGSSLSSTVIAITVVSWPAVARLVRGEFLGMRRRDFVQACIGLGMPDARIIFRHILPNCLAPIIVLASLMVATAILIESGLSFLGLSDPNVMSWGFQVG